MEKKKIRFIVNPISGGTSKNLIIDTISEFIDRERFSFDIVQTAYAHHAYELAAQAVKDELDIVVAVGGDGTINEVASAVVSSKTAMAIVPCGSGNGIARHLHIPLEYRKAIELINACEIQPIDYGKINEKPFFCTCGMGFDAYISSQFDKTTKRGPIAYLENVMREVINYQPEVYTLETEDGKLKEVKAFLITGANASQYGNNVYIAPKASVQDGLLDITIIEPFNFAEAPLLTLQFLNGTLPNKGNVQMFQTRSLRIHRQSEGYLHRDGEPFWGGQVIDLQNEHKQLNVVVNKNAKIKPISFLQSMSIVFRTKLYSNTTLARVITNSGKDILEKLGIK